MIFHFQRIWKHSGYHSDLPKERNNFLIKAKNVLNLWRFTTVFLALFEKICYSVPVYFPHVPELIPTVFFSPWTFLRNTGVIFNIPGSGGHEWTLNCGRASRVDLAQWNSHVCEFVYVYICLRWSTSSSACVRTWGGPSMLAWQSVFLAPENRDEFSFKSLNQ